MTSNSKDFIGKTVVVKIDRPLGSKHPKWGFEYSLNYGYIPETKSEDGEELDAYVLGVTEPLSEYKGKVVCVIHRIDDNDDKLVVTSKEYHPTDDQIEKEIEFQEKWFKHEIIR